MLYFHFCLCLWLLKFFLRLGLQENQLYLQNTLKTKNSRLPKYTAGIRCPRRQQSPLPVVNLIISIKGPELGKELSLTSNLISNVGPHLENVPMSLSSCICFPWSWIKIWEIKGISSGCLEYCSKKRMVVIKLLKLQCNGYHQAQFLHGGCWWHPQWDDKNCQMPELWHLQNKGAQDWWLLSFACHPQELERRTRSIKNVPIT